MSLFPTQDADTVAAPDKPEPKVVRALEGYGRLKTLEFKGIVVVRRASKECGSAGVTSTTPTLTTNTPSASEGTSMAEPQSTVTYRDIPGFPGYRVGSDGSVWSCKGRASFGKGHCGFKGSRTVISDEWHRLNPKFTRRGYLAIGIRKPGDRKTYVFSVHTLVLLAFVGPCPVGTEGCHNDGDRTNNAAGNLRWGTRAENYADRRRHGRDPVGEKNACAKLTGDKVRELRRRHAAGEPLATLASDFGIHYGTAWAVAKRKAWTHVTD